MRIFALALILAAPMFGAPPLAERITSNDPSKYRKGTGVHKGAGEAHFMTLLDAYTMNTNLLFVHRGRLQPKGGIGHHFHNRMEEMFVILDNEAEFTIDGRTSSIEGPAGAPCRMGHAHGIYNPTDKPTEWMNIAVSMVKGKYDNFDTNDDRVGAALDPTPVFISMQLRKNLLRPAESYHGGKGVALYRRALQPEVFATNWAYVDHLILPPGASEGRHRHAGVEEIYYVIKGQGLAGVAPLLGRRRTGEEETAKIAQGDVVPVFLNEIHRFENTGDEDLEFLIIGVALEKDKLDTVAVD